MSEDNLEKLADDFIRRCDIEVESDVEPNSHWSSRISATEHVTDGGADYYFTQLDYCEGDKAKASRMVAEILPGNRTELAYWNESAPKKVLDIHKGKCQLVIGSPVDGEPIRVIDAHAGSSWYNHLELPSGVFYSIQNPKNSTELLVISGYYDQPIGDWSTLEAVLQPGQTSVEVPDEGTVYVPKSFLSYFS